MDLYIYYRVENGSAASLRTQVLAMQAALAERFGISASLKRRPEETDGQQTWMEVYADAPADFRAALEQALLTSGVGEAIAGKRHTEVFMDMSSCA